MDNLCVCYVFGRGVNAAAYQYWVDPSLGW